MSPKILFPSTPACPLLYHSRHWFPPQNIISGSLSRLFSTDQRDNPAQLRTLCCMFLHQCVRHTICLGQLGGCLQHAILEMQHLLQRIVKERSREGDRIWRRLIETHLQLSRSFLLFCHCRPCWLLRLRLRPWQRVNMISGNFVPFLGTVFRVPTHLSTNVMLSAISATRFAILDAMMAYADVTPPPDALSPAMDAALFWTGTAAFCAYEGLATPLGVFFAAT